MKIIIDLTFLYDQYSKRGIGIYGRNVLKRLIPDLLKNNEHEIGFIGYKTLNENLIEIGYSQFTLEEIGPKLKFFNIGEANNSSPKNYKEWFKNYLPVLNDFKPDLFYAFHFERGLPSVPSYSIILERKPKTVIVCHDIIPLVTNSFSNRSLIHNFLKKRFYLKMFEGVRNADLIITASNYSKKDLVEIAKIDEKKIKVIYPGVDESFKKENNNESFEKQQYILDTYSIFSKKYFIYDSGLESNKGVNHLLNIFKELVLLENDNLPKKLVLIGKDFYKGESIEIRAKSELGEKTINLAKKLGILQNLITTDKISDEHLITLLKNSSVYVNFSMYEGFGLGVAQAMSAGVPVIAGNNSSIAEISKDGAFLIDLKEEVDYHKLAVDISDYLGNGDKVNKTVRRGLSISEKYNWNSTVEQTIEGFNKL